MKCTADDCAKNARARQLCHTHYMQWRRGKRSAPDVKKKPAIDRLLEKISKGEPDECWPWNAGVGSWGYGGFWINGTTIHASRAAYILLVGPVPDDKVVCHSCDNPICCNPSHLWVGTQQDNLEDCRRKGRARWGHA